MRCFFCGKTGHIKSECRRLLEQNEAKEKQKQRATHGLVHADTRPQNSSDAETKEKQYQAATNGFVKSSVSDEQRHPNVVKSSVSKMTDTCSSGRVDEKYKDFISKGTVTIAEFRVPVVILRDTGATQSLMVGDVKSMPIDCNTGRKVLIHDVNGGTQAVPLFRVNLDSGLISGEVIVGIVPFLPMDGVSFLLGNDLAGGRVSVLPVVSEVPVYERETENLVDEFPEVFPTCAITRFRASEAERVRKESGSEISLDDAFFGKV